MEAVVDRPVAKAAPFFVLRDLHPHEGDKSITIEEDSPSGRAEIAAHIEKYQKEGWKVYITLTEKKMETRGLLFKKPVEVEKKVSYLVQGYEPTTNDWILDVRPTDREVPPKRVRLQQAEVVRLRPCTGG